MWLRVFTKMECMKWKQFFVVWFSIINTSQTVINKTTCVVEDCTPCNKTCHTFEYVTTANNLTGAMMEKFWHRNIEFGLDICKSLCTCFTDSYSVTPQYGTYFVCIIIVSKVTWASSCAFYFLFPFCPILGCFLSGSLNF